MDNYSNIRIPTRALGVELFLFANKHAINKYVYCINLSVIFSINNARLDVVPIQTEVACNEV